MRKRKLSYQKAETWKQFSIYIRLRDADQNGYCKCATCDKVVFWSDGLRINAGHAVPGRGNAVLFDESLVHAQCSGCNNDGGGEQYNFIQYLKKKYNWDDGVIEEKLALRHQIKKYTVIELREMEIMYREESKKIAKEKGLIIGGHII